MDQDFRGKLDPATQTYTGGIIGRYELLLREEARKIPDPTRRAFAYQDIQILIAKMRSKPFNLVAHFGDFTLTKRDAKGKVLYYETFEKESHRDKAYERIKASALPGEDVRPDVVDKDVTPFRGLPKGLLELMAQKLKLSTSQKDALDQLIFESHPMQSFKHRLQVKDRTPGASQNLLRNYADFFFHGAHYLANVKYIDALNEQHGLLQDSVLTVPPAHAQSRRKIANFFKEHMDATLDPKDDYAALRSVAFLMYLGFSPAAAALNMSQLPLVTFPYLSSKFGDIKAAATMLSVSSSMGTYYKKGTLATQTQDELQAVSEAVKEGIITEAMAPELAGLAEGRGMLNNAGTVGRWAWGHVLDASAVMFEASEQFNRRITFRAAYRLATQNPNARFVKEATAKHLLQYDRLRRQGWSDSRAAAFVAAKEATEATQFV